MPAITGGGDFGLVTDKTIIYDPNDYGVNTGILQWVRTTLNKVGPFRSVRCQMYQKINDFCIANGYTEENPPLCTCIAHRVHYDKTVSTYDILDIYGLNGIHDGVFRFELNTNRDSDGTVTGAYLGNSISKFIPYRHHTTFGGFVLSSSNSVHCSNTYQFSTIPPGEYQITGYSTVDTLKIYTGTLKITDLPLDARSIEVYFPEYALYYKYRVIINRNEVLNAALVFTADRSSDYSYSNFVYGSYTPITIDAGSYITDNPDASPAHFKIMNCNNAPHQIIIRPNDDKYTPPTILYPRLGFGVSYNTASGTGPKVYTILVSYSSVSSTTDGEYVEIHLSSPSNTGVGLDTICYLEGKTYTYQAVF